MRFNSCIVYRKKLAYSRKGSTVWNWSEGSAKSKNISLCYNWGKWFSDFITAFFLNTVLDFGLLNLKVCDMVTLSHDVIWSVSSFVVSGFILKGGVLKDLLTHYIWRINRQCRKACRFSKPHVFAKFDWFERGFRNLSLSKTLKTGITVLPYFVSSQILKYVLKTGQDLTLCLH